MISYDSILVINIFAGSISSPGAKSLQKIYDVKNCLDTLPELPPNDEGSNRVNLVSIVCDYLSAQHSLCKNPMVKLDFTEKKTSIIYVIFFNI